MNTRRRCAWSVRTWRASELCTEYDAPHNPHTCRPRACSDQWLRSSARDAWPRPQVEHTHPPGGAGGSSSPSKRGDGAPPPVSPSPHTTHSARNNTTSKQPPEALVRQDAARVQPPPPPANAWQRASARTGHRLDWFSEYLDLRLTGRSYCGVLSRLFHATCSAMHRTSPKASAL